MSALWAKPFIPSKIKLGKSPAMDNLWQDAVARFFLLTGETLPVERSVSFDHLRQLIDGRRLSADEANNPARKKANDAALTTLKYLQILGGVAAQAGSAIFGAPSELCFNAASALLNIPQAMREYHEAVDAIFNDVGPTLAQFKIYSRIEHFSSLDSDFLSTIHLVMISFVDICAKCINIKSDPSRWSRFKKGTKRILLNDTELEGELQAFKDLARNQQNVQSALTLEATLEGNQKLTSLLSTAGETGERVAHIDKNVGILLETDRVFRSERTKTQKMAKIRSFLGIPDHERDGSKAIYEDLLRRSILPGKRKWWFEGLVPYQSWADMESKDTEPCLLVVGNPNSGKSFSVAAMINHLMAGHYNSKTSDHRMALSYSFFGAPTDKNDDDRQRLGTALKWIAIQLAEQDVAYAAHLTESLSDSRRNVQTMTIEQLWNFLKISNPNHKATHFVILDGLENLSVSETKKLLDIFRTLPSAAVGSRAPSPIRVLASGTPASFSRIHSISGWPSVQMESHNLSIMRDYIGHIMRDQFRSHLKLHQKVDEALIRPEVFMINLVLRQATSRDIRRAGAEMRELIASSTQEDKSMFRLVFVALDELANILSSQNASENILVRNARQHLEQAKHRLRSIERTEKVTFRGIQITLDEVKRLMSNGGTEKDLDKLLIRSAVDTWKPDAQKHEQRLDGRQIELLNELLIWVHFGRLYFTIDELEAVLVLRSKDIPLEGVRAFIDSKLAGIMFVDPRGLVRLVPDMEEEVVKTRSTPRSLGGPSTISLQISINNAPLPAVQRFFWDLAEHSSFDKFTFHKDTATSLSTAKPRIGVDHIDAYSAIVDTTLKSLDGVVDPRLKSIRGQLLTYLPSHLQRLQEPIALNEIDDEEKGRIGKEIYDLFDDVDIIRKYWSDFVPVHWFEEDGAHIKTFMGWITDDATSSRLSRKDRAWLQEVRHDGFPARGLLHPLTLMIAHLWLRTRDGDAGAAFKWIAGYLTEARHRELHEAVSKYHAEIQEKRSAPDEPEGSGGDNNPGRENSVVEPDVSGPTKERKDYQAFFQSKTASAITETASWCAAQLRLSGSDQDSLYYERLGATYANDRLYKKAAECYEIAMQKPNPSWKALEGLAASLWSLCEWAETCRTMESALADSAFREGVGTDDFVSLSMTTAHYFDYLPNPRKSFQIYQDVHRLRPDDLDVLCGLLESYFYFDWEEDAKRIIFDALDDAEFSPQPTDESKTQLQSMLEYLIDRDGDYQYGYIFAKIVRIAKSDGYLDKLLREIDAAVDQAQEHGRHYERALLIIWKGMMKMQDSSDEGGRRLALSLWEESTVVARQYLNAEPHDYIWERATWFQSFHHLGEALRHRDSPELLSPHANKLVELASHPELDGLSGSKRSLAYYYFSKGDITAARACVQSTMSTALSMLSDGDGSNDREGLKLLRSVLLHVGDGRNTVLAHQFSAPIRLAESVKDVAREYLSRAAETIPTAAEALQLFDRIQGEERPLMLMSKVLEYRPNGQSLDLGVRRALEKLAMTLETDGGMGCDGCQVTAWDSKNDIHLCYYCPWVYFCDQCLEKVKEGHRNIVCCDSSHSWLKLEKWKMDNWMDYLDGKARLPGENGERVTLSAWLTGIVKDWGLDDKTWD